MINLYEKFNSTDLSNTLAWLNDNRFINDLKKLCDINKIPMSELSDDDIKIMNYHDSLEHFQGNIKFWFNIDQKYIGMSEMIKMSLKKVENFPELKAMKICDKIVLLENGKFIYGYLWHDDAKNKFWIIFGIDYKDIDGRNYKKGSNWREWGSDFMEIAAYLKIKKEIFKYVEGNDADSIKVEYQITIDNNNIKKTPTGRNFLEDASFCLCLDLNKTKKLVDKLKNKKSERSKNKITEDQLRNTKIGNLLAKLKTYNPKLRNYENINGILLRMCGYNPVLSLEKNLKYIENFIAKIIDFQRYEDASMLNLNPIISSAYEDIPKSIKASLHLSKYKEDSRKINRMDIVELIDSIDRLNSIIREFISREEIENYFDLEMKKHRIFLIASMLKRTHGTVADFRMMINSNDQYIKDKYANLIEHDEKTILEWVKFYNGVTNTIRKFK